MASTAVVPAASPGALTMGPSNPTEIIEVWRTYYEIAEAICRTDFVPKALRNNPAATAASMLTGRELGLPEMASLSLIYILDGRPGLYAEGMRALVQSHGHEIWIDEDEFSGAKVTLWGKRRDSDKAVKVSWTQDMVQTAGLAGKENHRKYPRSMKLARCTGDLCRLMFADVIRGISYTVEEIQDGFSFEEPVDEIGSGEPEPPKGITRKASPPRKSAAAKKAAPPAAQPPSEPPLPPLPGEDEPASGSSTVPDGAETGNDDGQVLERSKSIAIACQRAGLDDEGRHRLIGFITNGRVASSKEVTAEEGGDVLQAAHDIANGHAQLIEADDGWELVHDFTGAVEDATGEGELVGQDDDTAGDVGGWSGDQWRALLKERGVKVTATIQAAQRIAGELGVKPPAALDQLAGQGELCGRLFAWVEEQTAG